MSDVNIEQLGEILNKCDIRCLLDLKLKEDGINTIYLDNETDEKLIKMCRTMDIFNECHNENRGSIFVKVYGSIPTITLFHIHNDDILKLERKIKLDKIRKL